MTVCFTVARHFAIAMTVDSAVVRDFEDGSREYDTGRKAFVLPSLGVVSTWGARDGNQIAQVLEALKSSKKGLTIGDVADRVREYLEREFQPHDRGANPVGFHIAGFRGRDEPVVYHVHWNPLLEDTKATNGYGFEKHDPDRDGIFILWNGREDLVHDVLVAVSRERQKKQNMPLTLDNAAGLVSLGHLAVRFAREISFEVCPPFFAHVITPDNQVHSSQLPEWIPLNDSQATTLNKFVTSLSDLRYVHHLP